MSEVIPATLDEAVELSDRHAYFEQRIFMASPLGTFGTSLAIFLLFAGTYALLTLALHDPLIAGDAHGGVFIPDGTRAALILSLLIAVALGIQRYARLADRADIASFPPILRNGAMSARHFAMLSPMRARLRLATAAGAVLGLGLSLIFIPRHHAAEWPWFVVVCVLVTMMFTRGVELTRAGSEGAGRFIQDELKIDLLRIDQLSVIGRSAARTALIWFAVSAVVCLFFVENTPTLYTIVLLIACAGMGAGIFVRTMDLAHRKILSVKRDELNRVRTEINILRHTAHADTDAALKLQGLLAYEARIQAVHEWPFDQTTLMRLTASSLILAAPLAGRIAGNFVLDHFGTLLQ
jgi:hypothetical protein